MKLQCATDRLSKSLSVVGRAIGSRSSLEVLNNVLLVTEDQRVKLVATNLEVAITCWLDAEISEDGAITVPARLLSEFVGSLPAGTIAVNTNSRATSLSLRQGGVDANIHGIDADEFPAVPQVGAEPTTLVAPADLREAVNQVVVAAADDDTRPVLSGVLARFDGDTLTLAAADGFRLAVRQVALQSPVAERRDAIVPARSLHELARIIGDTKESVAITVAPSHVLFGLGNASLMTRLVEGTFPNYTSIIPTRHECRVVVPTKALANATRVAMLFARDASNIVRLQATPAGDDAPGRLVVTAQASAVGDTSGDIEATVEGAVQITFNGKYLQEALGVVATPQVELRFTGPGAPGLILPVDGPDYQHVIMPMQTTR